MNLWRIEDEYRLLAIGVRWAIEGSQTCDLIVTAREKELSILEVRFAWRASRMHAADPQFLPAL
jgi:hypothetical protein